MIAKIRLENTIELTSPLAHTDRQIETISRFRRETMWIDGQPVEVPVVSGNAIRGYLRRAVARRICELIELPERSLSQRGFCLLFSGGTLEGTDWAFRVDSVHALIELLPHLLVFGCSYGSRLVPGHLFVDRAEPACRELQHLPHHQQHPAYTGLDPVPSISDLLAELPYSRRDDRAWELGDDQSPQQMRYELEVLVPGTRLVHGVTLGVDNELARGALAAAIRVATTWNVLGGRGAAGHGHFRWTLERDTANWPIEKWEQHTRSRAQEIRALLCDDKEPQASNT